MEFVLLRIMKGRLPFRECGLSLYINEPTQDLMYDSIEIYEDAYDKAYKNGVMIKEEMEEFLFNQEIYTPFDDVELEKLKKEHENLKLSAYKNALNKRELNKIKFLLKVNEQKQSKIIYKKTQFDYLTCDGVASHCRWNWIIEKSTFDENGLPYNWNEVSISSIMSYYENASISIANFRCVARSDYWRPVWNLGKKTGDIFGKPAFLMTKDQIALCSISTMYDNVYEHPEAPSENIIEDDDCLDGWFIDQKRKMEKQKKEQQVNNMLTNPKIANAGEVFIVANSSDEAKDIHSLNSPHSESARINRMNTIVHKGGASDLDFNDVKTDLAIQRNQQSMENIRRGR